MPTTNGCEAPRFSSDPSGFDSFFDDVAEHAGRATIDAAETIKWAIRYAGSKADSWRHVPCMKRGANNPPTFDEFRKEVQFCYPHLSSTHRYTVDDLECLLDRTRDYRDMDKEDLGTYYRRFVTYTGYLMEQGRLSEWERNAFYLRGFPQPVRVGIIC